MTIPTHRARAKKPKTKTGCRVCRNRHVKCDEGRPSCARCTKAGLICSGYDPCAPAPQLSDYTKQLLPREAWSHVSTIALTRPLHPKERRDPIRLLSSPETSQSQDCLQNGYTDDDESACESVHQFLTAPNAASSQSRYVHQCQRGSHAIEKRRETSAGMRRTRSKEIALTSPRLAVLSDFNRIRSCCQSWPGNQAYPVHALPLCRSVSEHSTTSIARKIIDFSDDTRWGLSRDWFVYIPARLESSPALALAASAVASAIQHRIQPGSAAPSSSLEQYSRAIGRLRSSLAHCETALLTILSLCYYEILAGGDIRAFKSHVSGIASLLLANPERWSKSNVARMWLYGHRTGTAEAFIAAGQPSPFERPIWLDIQPIHYRREDTKVLSRLAFQFQITLPRLVCYLRALSSSAEADRGTDAVANVVSLMETLLGMEDNAVYASFLSRVEKTETISDNDRSFAPFSFCFNDMQDYDTMVDYCRARLMVTSLRLVASSLVGNDPWPQAQNMRTEQLHMMDSILMCWQGCIESERFAKGMCTALIPVYGALSQMDTYHGLSTSELRSWLESKTAIAFNHWRGFGGAQDIVMTWEMYCGGSPEKGLFRHWASGRR